MSSFVVGLKTVHLKIIIAVGTLLAFDKSVKVKNF